MTDDNDDTDTVEIPVLREQVLAASDYDTNNDELALDGLNTLTAQERVWLEWFYSLPDEDQQIVQVCGEKDLSVTPVNFEQMKALVIENYPDELDPSR